MDRASRAVSESPLIQGLLLVGLLCVVPIQQLRRFSAVTDTDVWWHMRVGDWILAHHAFPHQGIFSGWGATRPWAAYSWGFEVVMATLVKMFGLLGLSVFVLSFEVLLVLGIFLLARLFTRSFWWAWLISALTVWALDPNRIGVTRPVSFTILFFTVELALIFWAQEARNLRILYWLPLVFFAWANFHIQFVYGLLVLGLFAAVLTTEYWVYHQWPSSRSWTVEAEAFPPARLWGIFAACFVATFLNPYTVGIYGVLVRLVSNSWEFDAIRELMAPTFRVPSDYAHLLLVAAAFFVLGRRKIDPFKLALLTFTAMVSFRSMRDVWFACIPAALIIAVSVRKTAPESATDGEAPAPAFGAKARQLIPVLAGALLVIVLSGADYGLSNRALSQTVHDSFPLDAAKFVEEHHFPGPLYNNFNWGGFLITNLPDYPVSIDGRTDVYGDDYFRQEIETLMGKRESDPVLDRANVVLIPASVPLAAMLHSSPQFTLVYSDKMAVVFVRNR